MGYGPKRHPQSAQGDFYVEEDCCLACGVPEAIAPDLVAHLEEPYWHCYWKKQPETPEELDKAIKILKAQELDCHRYGGSDQSILKRLPRQCCDVASPPLPRKVSNLEGTVRFALLESDTFFARIWRKLRHARLWGDEQ